MRRTVLTLLAVSSLLLLKVEAATRPRYGGTLHVAMREAPVSLVPPDLLQAGWPGPYNLARLLYDTLAVLDEKGVPQPSLAYSWQSDTDYQRWQISLRPSVTFEDGTPLTPAIVAASLRASNLAWKVYPASDYVIVECGRAMPDFPAALALAKNSIAKGEGKPMGTGPFTVGQWDPGKKLVLTAREDYWGGRAFIDSIDIELGKGLREQWIALESGKAQWIEAAPDQTRKLDGPGRRAVSSAPLELMAILFARDRKSPEDGRLRHALALSIDRTALSNVLLQGGGEPAGGLLPSWLSGYGFIFPVSLELAKARQLRAETNQALPWTLGYDINDPLARMVAERAALNARDADLLVQVTSSNTADMRVVRVPLVSLDGRVALDECATMLGLPLPARNGQSDDLYTAENSVLQMQRVVPLLHLRNVSAVQSTVNVPPVGRDGGWRLQDAWLGGERP